ncbi:hypothetical protein O181_003967 [Austropuccinia psidii MF-1]|uniref:Uncharacterized protein n=1 Tax=Austropuccinia psidii MF-1 TaxID=1389203 RepID=A0A9Q3BFV2_9BASI|nr:hypothetical protein [Austropuccinia psidii MF-1]
MLNYKKYFTSFQESLRKILLANGFYIVAQEILTFNLNLPHMQLIIKISLLFSNLSNKIIGMKTLLKTKFMLISSQDELLKVLDSKDRIILDGNFSSGNLVINQIDNLSPFPIVSSPSKLMSLHQLNATIFSSKNSSSPEGDLSLLSYSIPSSDPDLPILIPLLSPINLHTLPAPIMDSPPPEESLISLCPPAATSSLA